MYKTIIFITVSIIVIVAKNDLKSVDTLVLFFVKPYFMFKHTDVKYN